MTIPQGTIWSVAVATPSPHKISDVIHHISTTSSQTTAVVVWSIHLLYVMSVHLFRRVSVWMIWSVSRLLNHKFTFAETLWHSAYQKQAKLNTARPTFFIEDSSLISITYIYSFLWWSMDLHHFPFLFSWYGRSTACLYSDYKDGWFQITQMFHYYLNIHKVESYTEYSKCICSNVATWGHISISTNSSVLFYSCDSRICLHSGLTLALTIIGLCK